MEEIKDKIKTDKIKTDKIGADEEVELENVAKMFHLSTDDIAKMHQFIFQSKDYGDKWPILFDSFKLTENQKLFITYIKGVSKGSQLAEKRIIKRMNNKKLDKFDTFIDEIDAFEHISHGLNGWNTEEGIRILVSIIETIILAGLPKEQIPIISMLVSDTFCRFADDYKYLPNFNKNKKG